MNDPAQLEATIAALDAQRALLGDAVVDSALAPLRRELAAQRAAAASATAQRLKQVSVLFVDVVGSTAMGQRLEPEDVHAVMNGALERFTAVVARYGGRVLQYTGDGMLAAFGADEAHEDDVESAIRAGLDVVATAASLAPEMRRRHGVQDFDVRAGINTGMVLLGGGVDAEGNIRGAVVNIAARMEQTAPAGRLRVSHDSWRHVRGLFDATEEAPISVKGVELPMRTYLVERPRQAGFGVGARGIEGLVTPMVGRDAELALLVGAFDAVAAHGTLRAITVIGDAGLGKSRLLAEFRSTLERGGRACRQLLGRAQPRTSLQPYGLLRDLVTRELRIADADSPAVARDKLLAGLAPLLPPTDEAPAHILGHLIGVDFSASPHVEPLLKDAAQIRARGFAAMDHLVRSLAARAPVIVLLDDLHWCDEGSLEFVRFLLERTRDAPLLLVMLARADLLERRDDWFGADPQHGRIDIAALGAGHSRALADALLGRIPDAPPALRALVTEGAEGNPFYMEELVKMLIDDGVIVAEASGWRVLPERLRGAHVPATLTGVLQARIDALAPHERTALRHAAIVGQVFSNEALAAIDPESHTALPKLLRRQLVAPRDRPTADGVREYAFQHNLLHQVVYDGVLKAQRRDGHAKVGAYWSDRAAVASPQDVNPATCRALAEAHYHGCIADPQAWVAWFDGQFSHYLNAYAAQALRPLAEALVEVCEQQFGADSAEAAKALTNLARVELVQGELGPVEALLRRAIAIQESALGEEHPDAARTIAVLGVYFQQRGDHGAAATHCRRALAIRERTLGPEHPLTVGILEHLAFQVSELGQLDEAEALSRRVLEVRERQFGPEHPETCIALTSLGDVLSKRKNHAAAEPLIRRALAAQEKHLPPEHPDAGLSMWNLAEALHGLGRDAEAEALARRSLALWEKALGPKHEWTAWSLSSLARLRLVQRDAGEAAGFAARALEIHELTLGPDHRTVGENLDLLARALRAKGDHAGAEPLLERALAIQVQHLDAAAQATRALLDETRSQIGRSLQG